MLLLDYQQTTHNNNTVASTYTLGVVLFIANYQISTVSTTVNDIILVVSAAGCCTSTMSCDVEHQKQT